MSAPALSAARCLSSIYANRLRVSRLHDSGTLDPGATNQVVTDSLVKIGYAPQIQAGQEFTGYNGSGGVCVYATEDDKVLRYNLTMDLCTIDFELQELVLGGRTLTTGGITVGYEDRALSDVGPKVCVEAWTTAYEVDAQAIEDGLALYVHHVFPLVKWTIGASTLERAPFVIPLTGKAVPNASMGLGPNAEWPEVITGAHAMFLDDAIPDAVCGYQALVVAGSAS